MDRQVYFKNAAADLRARYRSQTAFIAVALTLTIGFHFLTNDLVSGNISRWVYLAAWMVIILYHTALIFIFIDLISIFLKKGDYAQDITDRTNAMYRFHCNEFVWRVGSGSIMYLIGALLTVFTVPEPFNVLHAIFVIIMILIGRLIIRLPQKNRSVLWLRKFGRLSRKTFPINRLFQDTYGGWWTLTLKDRELNLSIERAITRAAPYMIYIVPVMLILFPFLEVSGLNYVMWSTMKDELGMYFGGLIYAFGLTIVFCSPWLFKIFENLWETAPDSDTTGAYVRRIIDEQANARLPAVGVTVLKTTEQNWKENVTAAIKKVDVILLDLTEMTENIDWEIKTVFHLVAPEKVIIAFESTEPGSEAIGDDLRSYLGELVGLSKVDRTKKFGYPAARGRRVDVDVLAHNMILTSLVAECIDSG